MNEEEFISLELAELLSHKGFNEPCIAVYELYGTISSFYNFIPYWRVSHIYKQKCPPPDFVTNESLEQYKKENVTYIAAPTLLTVLNWLKKQYNIIVTIDYDEYELISDNKKVGYGWCIQKIENPTEYLKISEYVFDFYEESIEDAIKYCLETLI